MDLVELDPERTGRQLLALSRAELRVKVLLGETGQPVHFGGRQLVQMREGDVDITLNQSLVGQQSVDRRRQQMAQCCHAGGARG